MRKFAAALAILWAMLFGHAEKGLGESLEDRRSLKEDFDNHILLYHAGVVCSSVEIGSDIDFMARLYVLGSALGMAQIETAIHTSKMAEQHAAEYQADPISYCRHASKVFGAYR